MATDVVPIPGVQRGGNTGTTLGNTGGQDMVGISGVTALGANIVTTDVRQPTYRYSASAATPAATPTTFLAIQGSATRTIRIKRIVIGGQATASGNLYVSVNRRSSGAAGGTASGLTAVKHDINDPNATAVAAVYTANPSAVGTLVGQIGVQSVNMGAIGTGTTIPAVFEFSTRSDKALVVRGVNDFITVDFAGQAVPSGGTINYEIETEEDQS